MKAIENTTFAEVKKGDLIKDYSNNRISSVEDVEISKSGRIKITFKAKDESGEYEYKRGFCSPNTIICG
jgi:hypothetical protein